MVFLNAHRSLEQGVEPRSEQAWLFKIAEHVVMHRRRTIARRARVEFPIDINGLADLVAAPGLADDPELAGLSAALARLPEAERRAIVLREWCGLSYREVAVEIGVSVSAAENLIVRGRRRLAHELGGSRSTLRRRTPLALVSPLTWLKWLLGVATPAKVVVGATSVAVLAVGSGTVALPWQSAESPAVAASHAVLAASLGTQLPHRAVALRATISTRRSGTPKPAAAPAPAAVPAPEQLPAPEVTAEPTVPAEPDVRDPEVVTNPLAAPDPEITAAPEAPADPLVPDDPAAPSDVAVAPVVEVPPAVDVPELVPTTPADETGSPADRGRPADVPGLGPEWAGGPGGNGQPQQPGGNPEHAKGQGGAPAEDDVVLPPVAAASDESGRGPAQGLEHDWVDLAAVVDPLLEILDPRPGVERRVAEPSQPFRHLDA
jgi:RNA polymerase sigma factor (sigma-70 family)